MVSGIYSFNSHNLASIYNQNSALVAESLARLSSGRKVVKPSDDIQAYFRGQELQTRSNGYADIKTELEQWSGAMDVAQTATDEIYNKIIRMQDLTTLAGQTTDATLLSGYQAEYNLLANDIDNVVNGTTYQGKALLDSAVAIATLSLSPENGSYTLSINPGVSIADATLVLLKADNITTAGGLTTAKNNLYAAAGNAKDQLKTYMGKIASYTRALEAHTNIAESAIENYQSSINSVININEAEEMVTYTARDIRMQAAMAMLAHSNNSSRSILALYGLQSG